MLFSSLYIPLKWFGHPSQLFVYVHMYRTSIENKSKQNSRIEFYPRNHVCNHTFVDPTKISLGVYYFILAKYSDKKPNGIYETGNNVKGLIFNIPCRYGERIVKLVMVN